MGYVPIGHLKEVYILSYVVNRDLPIYKIEQVASLSGQTVEISTSIVTDETVGSVSTGTQVKYKGVISDTYAHIVLPDGTEGCMLRDYLDEIRMPK